MTAEAPNFSESLATRALPTIGTIGTPASLHHVKTSREKPAPAMTRSMPSSSATCTSSLNRRHRDHDVDADDAAVGDRARVTDLAAEFVVVESAAGDHADTARGGNRAGERGQRDAHGHAALDDGQSGSAVTDRQRWHFHVCNAPFVRDSSSVVHANTPGGDV